MAFRISAGRISVIIGGDATELQESVDGATETLRDFQGEADNLGETVAGGFFDRMSNSGVNLAAVLGNVTDEMLRLQSAALATPEGAGAQASIDRMHALIADGQARIGQSLLNERGLAGRTAIFDPEQSVLGAEGATLAAGLGPGVLNLLSKLPYVGGAIEASADPLSQAGGMLGNFLGEQFTPSSFGRGGVIDDLQPAQRAELEARQEHARTIAEQDRAMKGFTITLQEAQRGIINAGMFGNLQLDPQAYNRQLAYEEARFNQGGQ